MSVFFHESAKIVKQALSHQKPDRLPMFVNAFWDEFTELWRKAKQVDPGIAIEDYYGNDLVVLAADEELFVTRKRRVRQGSDSVYVDDGWGRIVRQKPGTSISEAVEWVLNSPADLDSITFDGADLDIRYERFCQQVSAEKAKGRPVFVKIGGPFIRSSFFRGEDRFLMDLAADQDFASELVSRVGEHLLQIGLESLRRADAYGFGVWIFDDMCNTNAPMFSPKTFENIFLPVYKHIVGSLKTAGAAWVMLHCDGNLRPFLDLLIEAGIDGINPVEYSAGLRIPDLMEQYRDRLSFIGGVCNTQILPSNDPAKIREHVKTIADAGRNGGLVIGTHSIGPDVSVESMDLFYRIVHEG